MVILLRFSTTVGPLLESSVEDKSGLVGFATASSFEWCVDRVAKEQLTSRCIPLNMEHCGKRPRKFELT